MVLSKRGALNYKIFSILTIGLIFVFNLYNYPSWNHKAIIPLIIILVGFNYFITKVYGRKIFGLNKIRMKAWINYVLISLILWFIGGLYNPSFHIYHTFVIISAIALIDKKDGLLFFGISNLVFIGVFFNSIIDFHIYSTFLYVTISGVFLGVFIEENNRKSERLDRRVKEFEALYKISKIVDAFPSTKVILDNTAEIVAKTLDIDECLIMLYDEEKDVLSTRARYGTINPRMQDAVFARGEGISGKVLVTKEKVISSNLIKDRHILEAFKYQFGIISCAIIPLIHKEKSVGVMAVYSSKKYDFTKDRVELLDIIASRIVSVLENDRLYKEVKMNSITDGLTKLYNHRYFYDILNKEINKAKTNNYHVYLLMMDIDKFKLFNDTYGHTVGDRALMEISDIIKENIRHSDFAARYGGEEFAVILPNTSSEIAERVGERIRNKIKNVTKRIDILKDEEIEITVSIGMACYPECAKNTKELVDRADIRMYLGKKKGGNNVIYLNKLSSCGK